MKTITLFSFILLFCCCQNKTSKKVPDVPQVTIEVPQFNADSAYKYVQEQVNFGYRIPNTPAHRATAEYLAKELERHGAEVRIQEASVTAYDGTILNAKNIIASFLPEQKNRILLCAHWDTRPYADEDPDPGNHRKPILGANDGGSGVGVLLEIARQINIRKPAVGIDIILFDAEDYGTPSFLAENNKEDTWALGAQYWARRPHSPRYRARYGILLDMVGGKNATFRHEGFSMQYAPQVVKKVWDTAQKLGYGRFFENKGGGYITDDHIYVNNSGTPTIDIIDYNEANRNGFNNQWHTIDDNMDYIDPASLKAVGQTVLTVIYNEK